jgi:Flp pilus assembly protein TadD
MNPKRRLSHVQGYLELGMVAEAAAEFGRIGAPENGSNEAVGLRLAILQEQENWPMLRDVAAEFVRRVPDESAGWVTWAYAARRAESLAVAEKILLEAESLHPVEPTIQFNLGCYACQRGDLAAARRRVDRAIALEPKFAEAARTDPDLARLRAAPITDCQTSL